MQPKPAYPDKAPQPGRHAELQYTSLSIQMMAVIGSAGWAGQQLDRYLGLSLPWCLGLFSIVGTCAMLYKLIKQLH